MKKKRIVSMVLAAIMLAAILCACGRKTFKCGVCRKEVTQTPHTVSAFGQEIEVCDSCYKSFAH
ncbi:MAG: hypothetical protein ACI3V3_02150 [Faecousia sp.]